MDERDRLIRHFLATLAYRAHYALDASPSTFGGYRAGPDVRTPHELVHHMNALFARTLSALEGRDPTRLDPAEVFDDEVSRFHDLVARVADAVGRGLLSEPATADRLLQGPFCDAMTHVGQIALLRRLAGAPVTPDNFYRAAIDAGSLTVAPPTGSVE